MSRYSVKTRVYGCFSLVDFTIDTSALEEFICYSLEDLPEFNSVSETLRFWALFMQHNFSADGEFQWKSLDDPCFAEENWRY